MTGFCRTHPRPTRRFCEDNGYWLPDYALFMALKDAHGGRSWTEWEPAAAHPGAPPPCAARASNMPESHRLLAARCSTCSLASGEALKGYANAAAGHRIIGDLPIYVAADSADVWSAPVLFQLDENCEPTEVAGCPPDGFSADGQLWGNPLYRWDAMKADGYRWWLRRLWATRRSMM